VIAVCVYAPTSAKSTLVSYVAGRQDERPHDWFPPLLRAVARQGQVLYTWRPQQRELELLYGRMVFRLNPFIRGALREQRPLIVRSDSGEVNGVEWADPARFDLQPLMQD
jgi:hypothetical protein